MRIRWFSLRAPENGDGASGGGADVAEGSPVPPAEPTGGSPKTGEGGTGIAEESANPPADSLSAEETQMVRRYAYEAAREQKVNAAVASIKRHMPDFDFAAVKSHLTEIYKKDKLRAEELNNPIGWERVWLEIKAQNAKDYDFSPPRNAQGAINKDKLIEEAANGDLTARADLIAARRRNA